MQLAIIFAVKFLGFTPRLALESADSAEVRFEKIVDLIRRSKYAVHDLSSMTAAKKGESYRLNMAFELGLDYGCKKYKPGKWNAKKFLVLERDQYSYQKALSDISGSDIRHHSDQPIEAVTAVRDWFVTNILNTGSSPTKIWYEFNEFTAYLEGKLASKGYSKKDYNTVPIKEVMNYMDVWFVEEKRT